MTTYVVECYREIYLRGTFKVQANSPEEAQKKAEAAMRNKGTEIKWEEDLDEATEINRDWDGVYLEEGDEEE